MKKSVFFKVSAGALLVHSLFFIGCATTGKIVNTVAGTTWSYEDEDGFSSEVSFTDTEKVNFSIDQKAIEGTYTDVDANGKNGTITVLSYDGSKLAYAETMVQLGKYGTSEFTLLRKMSGGDSKTSVANTKWISIGIPLQYEFLPDGKVIVDAHIKISGTYQYTSADTIVLTLEEYGASTATITPGGITVDDLEYIRK